MRLDYQSLKSDVALHFIFSYVLPITQCYKQRIVQEAPLKSIQSLRTHSSQH